MMVFNDFAIEKCGNKNVYFLVDARNADDVRQNTWTLDSAGYICRNINGTIQRLHTFIIEKKPEKSCRRGCM